MAVVNYYPFHIGDYLTATRHLTWDEDLAYRRLIEAYYSSETMLPADKGKLYLIVNAHTAKHRAAVDKVLAEYFETTPEGYRNERCEEEIDKASDKRGKAAVSAHMRWQSNGNANAPPNALRSQSGGNAPNPNPNKKGAHANGREGKAGRIPVIEGSPAWDAWKATGQHFPLVDIRIDGRIKRGWYFPSEFPVSKQSGELT